MKALLTKLIALLSLIPMVGFGQMVKTVEASGVGSSEKSALLDASRNAVSQVVTTLVESQTTTLDEAIVEDKIIAVSGGFIKEFTVIEPAVKQDSGFYLIKIKANVMYDELSAEIAKYSSTSLKINMGSIINGIKEQEEKDAQALLILEEKQKEMGDFLLKIVDDFILVWKFEATACLPGKEKNEVTLTIQKSLTDDDYVSKFVLPTQKKLKALGIIPKPTNTRFSLKQSLPNNYSNNTVHYQLSVFDETINGKMTKGFEKFVIMPLKEKKYIVRIELKNAKNEVLSSKDYYFSTHYDAYRIDGFDFKLGWGGCSIYPSSPKSLISSHKTITMKVYEPHKITDITQIDVNVLHVDKDSPCDARW